MRLIGSRMINIGSLGGLATTLLEKYVGFWAAYLLSFCSLWVSVLILVVWRHKFGKCCFFEHHAFY